MADPRQVHPKPAQKVEPHQPDGGGHCTVKAHQQGAGRGRVLCGYGRGRARVAAALFKKKKNLINVLNQ
jgi:hypothetical protein